MKNSLSLSLSLSLLILITACSTSATRTMTNNGDDQNGGGTEVAPPATQAQLLANPARYLQTLPTSFISDFPIPRPAVQVQVYLTGFALADLYFVSLSDRTPTINSSVAPSGVLAKLFNDKGFHGIARYKGTITPNNNTTDKGDSTNPLYNKLFTYQAGDVLLAFGYFNTENGMKIYSYDPATNTLGDYEMIIGNDTTDPRYILAQTVIIDGTGINLPMVNIIERK